MTHGRTEGGEGAGHAGHGVRARGRYLFPVHQEKNSPNELRDEDEAHEDEELEGSRTKESENQPDPAGSSLPAIPPFLCSQPCPCPVTAGGHRGRVRSSWGQMPHVPAPWLQGGGLKTSTGCRGLGMPKKLGCRCSERGF